MDDDPHFAMPVAWSVWWNIIWVGQAWSTDPARDLAAAQDLGERAISLDPNNALALAMMAHLRSYLMHDYDAALAFFDRALRAGPSHAIVVTMYAVTLAYPGRGEEAVRNAKLAIRLSPFDPRMFLFHCIAGFAHFAAGFTTMPRNMRARRMPHHPDLPQMSAYSSHPWPQLATTRGRVRQGRDFWNSSPSLTSAATSKPFCPIGNLRFVRISSRACVPQGCSRQPRPLAPGPKSREQNGGRNYSSIWPGGSASAIREGSADRPVNCAPIAASAMMVNRGAAPCAMPEYIGGQETIDAFPVLDQFERAAPHHQRLGLVGARRSLSTIRTATPRRRQPCGHGEPHGTGPNDENRLVVCHVRNPRKMFFEAPP